MSFIALIVFGSALLMLPFAHNGELRVVDALFTSTSAVCVTGLIVKDTAGDFTLFGQFIIMLLIQIGGLGYMTAVTFLTVIRRQKIAHRDRMLLQESLNYPGMEGLVRFLKIVVASIALIEISGIVILTLRFWADMPFGKALWFGTFHAVSAFNNAGFSLFNDNLMGYSQDIIINLTVPFLIILGGVGYLVIIELSNYYKKELNRISTHTKIVLTMYVLLIILGMFLLLSLEWDHAFKGMSSYHKIMAAWFASVNYRTAGFNTIDLSTLTDSNLFFGTFFMMTGGGPGGTAGGLKVTTVALAFLGMWYTLRGETNVHIFHRSIPSYQINKAYTIIFIASLYVVFSTVVLSEIEKLPFLRILFEATSAFGTVGLSTGNGGVLSYSALFSDAGKLNIMLLMLMGRIGVFAFTIAIIGKAAHSRIKYSEGRIIV
ncbi:MAG: TrkH family potassium uptake protein [Sulfurovaceae bacterium]|nr:TrkH family potassium uptake protein [Sulfurovaceae bacterium]